MIDATYPREVQKGNIIHNTCIQTKKEMTIMVNVKICVSKEGCYALYYFCNFSVSLKLFSNRSLNNVANA